MKVKNIIVSLSLLVAGLSGHSQQGTIYTQYGSTTTPLNNAGSFLHPEGELNFIGRQQWAGLEGAPESYRLSGSLPIGSKGIIGGLNLSHDMISIERKTEVIAFSGKSIQLNSKHYLAVSVGAGLSIYKGNFSGIDAQDPVFSEDINETDGLLSLSTLFYQPEKYYVGLSVPRIAFSNLGLSSTEDQRERYNQYHFIAGALIPINEDFDIKPAGLLTWSKDVSLQADISAILFLKKTVGLGANVRTYGDMAGMLQFYTKRLNLGYSYQFNTNNQPLKRGINNNTHELSIGYRFGKGTGSLL